MPEWFNCLERSRTSLDGHDKFMFARPQKDNKNNK